MNEANIYVKDTFLKVVIIEEALNVLAYLFQFSLIEGGC